MTDLSFDELIITRCDEDEGRCIYDLGDLDHNGRAREPGKLRYASRRQVSTTDKCTPEAPWTSPR